MRSLLGSLVPALWLAGAALAASGPHDVPLPGGGPPHVPPVTYIVHAKVVPDSLRVTGAIDIDYRNDSFDTLSQICFVLDLNDTALTGDSLGRPYCRVDSLLYRGAPIRGDSLSYDGILLWATIPGGVLPQENSSFFLTFKSRLSPDNRFDKGDGLFMPHWFPVICARTVDGWQPPDPNQPDSSIREFADFNVELTVDSSWSAAFPGELINDKQHFGLVPPPDDSVQIDILANYSQIPNGKRYTPVFDGGLKSFFVKSRNETGFPVVLHRDFIYDRAAVDSVLIQVAYGDRQKKRWRGTVAADAARFVKAFTDSLGPMPHDRLSIAPAPLDDASAIDASIELLPYNENDRDALREIEAVRTAQLWFSRPAPIVRLGAGLVDEGLACYAAMSLAAPDDSKTTYYYLDQYRKWRDGLRFEDSTSTELAVRTIPGWLRICRAFSDDSIVWGALRDYVHSFRYTHPPADTLAALLAQRADPVMLPTLAQAAWLLDSLDITVGKTSFKKTGEGYSVSCEILQNSPIDLPIEIGYVDDKGDTTYTAVTVQAHPASDDVTTIDFLSARPITAVVLDPQHRLPDFNRNNNYRLAYRTKFRYEPPATLFPAFASDRNRRWRD